MPTDLHIDHRQRLILVRDRGGIGLPFSKGIMATSILATGLETLHAHRIAAEIEGRLRERRAGEIAADELVELAAEAIDCDAGSEAAQRYRAWRRAKRAGRPLVVTLAGAPGVGKSTVATRLALRLGIKRVVPSDAIREVLRTVIPATVLPELHVSTFETATEIGPGQFPLATFLRQAHAVGAATAAVAGRMGMEGRSLIVEGVHLLPGEVRELLESHESAPLVIEVLLTLDDEEAHRAHFAHRLRHEPARDGRRHLAHFPVIRRLQEELRRIAREAQVDEYDVSQPRDLTQRIVDQVVSQVDTELQLVGQAG